MMKIIFLILFLYSTLSNAVIIHVRHSDTVFSVDINPINKKDYTIKDFKKDLEIVSKIPAHKQKLVAEQEILQDDAKFLTPFKKAGKIGKSIFSTTITLWLTDN